MTRRRAKTKRAPAQPAVLVGGQPSVANEGSAAEEGISRRRLWLFRLVLAVMPLAVLLLIEAGLRLGGYGVPLDFTLRQKVGGDARILSNPAFTRLFFEPRLARLFPPFSLAERKGPRTCRVFVLGSSAAQGDPEPAFGLARMLEVLLRDRYPGVTFEVTNAAATAVNSHVVYRVASAVLDLEPDLLVLYTGNNEVVGPFGAGTVLTTAPPSLPLVRGSLTFRATRLGQLFDASLRRLSESDAHLEKGRAAWAGMEMFLERQVRISDPSLQSTYANYAANLGDTLTLARRKSVPVLLATMAVNLRNSAPFASLHEPTLSAEALAHWDALFREGVVEQEAEAWAEATVRYRKAEAIDPGHAELQYRLATCASAEGRHDESRVRFARARDLDALRFRADSTEESIVRRIAEQHAGFGLRLVDIAKTAADASPNGVPGEELFLDHVHFTFAGNHLVSVALLDAMRDLLPPWVQAEDSSRPALDEAGCARQLVFTELDRYMLAETMGERLAHPPFVAQADHALHVKRYSDERARLAARGKAGAMDEDLRAYRTALAAGPVHWTVRERFARIAQRLGDNTTAESEWRHLTKELPQYPAFPLALARVLREEKRYPEAESVLRGSKMEGAENALLESELARLALHQGRVAEATDLARHAVALDPSEPNALYILATCLCRAEGCGPAEEAEATRLLETAWTLAPESLPIRRDLARRLVRRAEVLGRQGSPAEAQALLERAVVVHAESAEAHESLGLLFAGQGDRTRAMDQLTTALRLEPARAAARRALDEALSLESRQAGSGGTSGRAR